MVDYIFNIDACKHIMADKGITQNDLAEKLQCPRPQVNRYLNNRTEPRLKRISEIAKALNVKVEDLLVHNGSGGGRKEPELTPKEKRMLREFQSLTKESRMRILYHMMKDSAE